jgi:hypothetical protein
VQKDGFIRLGDVDYSVPPGLARRRVPVRVSPREVVVHLEGGEIARHRRSFQPADVVLYPAHARALRLAREARSRLASGDVEMDGPDLSRYDALVGVEPSDLPGHRSTRSSKPALGTSQNPVCRRERPDGRLE